MSQLNKLQRNCNLDVSAVLGWGDETTGGGGKFAVRLIVRLFQKELVHLVTRSHHHQHPTPL